ncbi:MAG: hypothetical protein E7350_02260 [Clostridiales bacterium]|nr:hypothetical protein [Clostridiales bacterium]
MKILEFLKSLLNGNKTNKEEGKTSQDKLDELKNYVDSQYGSYMPAKKETAQVPTYDKYEYEAPTDEQIKRSATDELVAYKEQNEKAISQEYAQKEKELAANKAASAANYGDSSAKLKATYEEAAQSLSDDALKRGLARSSIALNNQAAASKAYTQSQGELLNKYNENISAIDEELNGLAGKLQSALDSFKISYAAKLTERINELKEQREENKQKALEYNNSLLSKQYEQTLDKDSTESDLYTEALNQQKIKNELKNTIPDGIRNEIEANIYNKVVELLNSMSFDEARTLFLNEPIFHEVLNDYYYYTLYYKYR